jgi:hypothetical protein
MFYVLVDLSYSLIWFLLIIGSSVVRLIFSGRISSIKFSLYIALIYLYLGPTIGLFINGAEDALPFVALFILAIDVIAFFASRWPPRYIGEVKSSYSDVFVWLCFIFCAGIGGVVLAGSDKFASLFAFIIPFSLSLVFFEKLARDSRVSYLLLMLVVYFLVIGIYIIFYWHGFGRLVIGAYVLMPVLIADHHRDFGLRIWHAIVLAPPFLMVSHLSRYGSWGGLQDLAGGSAAHHLVLTLQLVHSDIHVLNGGFGRFLEQFSLFFLNWVPRDLWPNKPIGLGLISVDEWFGRAGFPDGFTISLGMFGEQLYLSGPFFFVFYWMFFVLCIIITRVFIKRISFHHIAPVVAFDVNLISFVWGGGATFGSRSWFFIVPMLVTLFILEWSARKAKSRSGPAFAWALGPRRP